MSQDKYHKYYFSLMFGIFFFAFCYVTKSYSQIKETSQEGNFTKCMAIKHNGDSLTTLIKLSSAAEMCKQIYLQNPNDKDWNIYTPNEIKYFQFGINTYYSKTLHFRDQDLSLFMRALTIDYLSLYEVAYFDNFGPNPSEYIAYILEREGEELVVVTKPDFQKDMSQYFSDYPGIAYKIEKRKYVYNDLQKIVNTYNDWHKNQLSNNDSSSIRQEDVLRNMQRFSISDVGLELPLTLNYTHILSPEHLNLLTPVLMGGSGFQAGLGIRMSLNPKTCFRFGYSIYTSEYNPEYSMVATVPGHTDEKMYIIENGQFVYNGFFFLFSRNINSFFVGGGFSSSINYRYKSSVKYYNLSNDLLYEKKLKDNTALGNDILNKMDLVFLTGFDMRINSRFYIKPIFSVQYPIAPILHTNAYVNINPEKELNPKSLILNFGALFDIGIQ